MSNKFFVFLLVFLIPTFSFGAILSAHKGFGLDNRLIEIPFDIVTGKTKFEPTYFYSLSWTNQVPSLINEKITNWTEIQVVKHYGLQKHIELSAALLWQRTFLYRQSSWDFSIGNGLSYAFKGPQFEKGPEQYPEKRYRLQHYITAQLSLGQVNLPWKVLLKIHHRSGVYGLIAPPKVGSNFLTIGLSYVI